MSNRSKADRSVTAEVIRDFSLAGGTRLERLAGIFQRDYDGKFARNKDGTIKLAFVDFEIFSEDYMRSHLVGMSEADMYQMEEAYAAVRDTQFSRMETLIAQGKVKPTGPVLTPVIGNTGAGRSRLIQGMDKGAVVCSTDDFMMEIPSFKAACKELHNYANEHGDAVHDYVRKELAKLVEKHRPAAQFMANLMMLETLGNDLHVIAELTGKNPGIATMLRKAQKEGVAVDEAFIVLADAKTCKTACERREASYSPICVEPRQAVKDHDAVLENIPVFMAELKGKVKILARYDVNDKLEVVASGTKHEYTINHAQLPKYNATFGADMAIGDLMGEREMALPAEEYKSGIHGLVA